MKRIGGINLIVGTLVLVCSAGCAKHELVRQDEVIPATSPAPKQATKLAAPEPEAKKSEIAVSADDKQHVAAPVGQAADRSLQSALEKVYFNFDSSNLSTQARETLAKNAELLKKNPGSKIRIEGNCDEIGSEEYNLALGDRRANAAKQYLLTMGIAPERLTTVSYGKEKPADPGHDEAARAKNRRDEFVVFSPEQLAFELSN